MYCKICGAKLGENVSFCTQCGTRIEKPSPEEVFGRPTITDAKAPEINGEPAESVIEEAAVQEKAVTAAPAAEGADVPPVQESVNVPPDREIREEPAAVNSVQMPPSPAVKEKPVFGAGALVFCLVLIGLLSLSTGAFAGLYFSLLTRA